MTENPMNSINIPLKVKVILCCLLAPAFDANLMNALALCFDRAIGYEPVKITSHGVLGCFPEQWMFVLSFFIFTPVILGIYLIGLRLSRSEKNEYKLFGALLLFGGIYNLGNTILYAVAFGRHPFLFVENKVWLTEQVVPLFGNAYTFMWAKVIARTSLQLFFLYVCYQVVFRYWDKQLRIVFFTYGAPACALGLYLWYFVLGPFLY
jgi:hypothetical protein